MARKKKHEEHVNAEAWAIPYGDLVTLLFALFTVMYAMSSVNEGKFRVLSDSMIAAFRGAPKNINPISVGDKNNGNGGDKKRQGVTPTVLMKLPPINNGPPAAPRDQAVDALPAGETRDQSGVMEGQSAGGMEPKKTGLGEQPSGAADGRSTGADSAVGSLERMERAVRGAMGGLIDTKMVSVKRKTLWLEVEINTDILFPSGSSGFSGAAVPVLDKLADALKPFPNPIRVEGHTDNRPIRTSAFPSNWELSAARAATVVHEFTKTGIDPMRLEIVGLGEFHPLQPNDSAAGRNANRRVAILILEQTSAPDAVSARARDLSPHAAVAANAVAADPSGAENRIVEKVPATELEKTVLIEKMGKPR
jgi:chemotaxis protein MotB